MSLKNNEITGIPSTMKKARTKLKVSSKKSPSADSLLSRLELKKTSLRRLILNEFSRKSKALSQGELLSNLQKSGAKIDRVSVYRNLNQLKNLGAIHEIDANQYVLCDHECQSHPHLILVCETCHTHVEVKDHKLVDETLKNLRRYRFFGTQRTVALKGACQNCD